MLTIYDVQDVIDDMSFAPGEQVFVTSMYDDVDLFIRGRTLWGDEFSGIGLRYILDTYDSTTRTPADFATGCILPKWAVQDRYALERAVVWSELQRAVHEQLEWVRVGGEPVYNPHADGGSSTSAKLPPTLNECIRDIERVLHATNQNEARWTDERVFA